MRSDTATLRARLLLTGAAAGAVMVMLGALLVGARLTRRQATKYPSGHLATLGLPVGLALVAAGLVLLLVFAFSKSRMSRRSRRRSAHAANPRSPAAQPRPEVSEEPDVAPLRVGAPLGGAGHPVRDTGVRSRRERDQVLSPTTVYSPRGLLDIPRDARAPGSAGPPESPWPQGASGAYPPGRAGAPPRPPYPPGTHPGGPGRVPPDQGPRQPPPPAPSGQAGQPRAPGQAAAPAWSAPPPGPASGPREAGPPRPSAPGRGGAPSRDSPWSGGPHPAREAGPAGPPGQGPRLGPDRQPPAPGSGGWPPRGPGYAPAGGLGSPSRGGPGRAPGGPSHVPGPGQAPPAGPGYASPAGPGYAQPGGPGYAPSAGPGYGQPRSPGYAPPGGPGYGQPRGFGYTPPGDPGYAPPGGRRPAPPRPSGPPPGTFTGGYAPVIRATDHPAPPTSAGRTGQTVRPGGSGGPPDDELYVYRDQSARAGYLADQRAQEREAAYWYDLSAEPGVTEREETRGPFEPLVPSSGPPRRAARPGPSGPGPSGPGPSGPGPSGPDAMTATQAGLADEAPEEPAHVQARKLEQIKDLYLTAEAIGEENVDKHFDQLLAQQRELISEYFRQSAAARHADGLPAQAAANPIEPRQPGGQIGPIGPIGQAGQAGPPEGAGVAAEPPRAW